MQTNHQYDIDPGDLDPDGIAENQTSAGAGNLTLNGAICDLGTTGQFDIEDYYSAGIAGVKLIFDSAGDISGVTFTITGEDEFGNAQTETVTGVTTTAVSTTKFWSNVQTIASDGAIGSNVFVGVDTGELVSTALPLNSYSTNGASYAVTDLSGTCQFDIEETYDNVLGDGMSSATSWAVVESNGSANLDGVGNPGATAMRLRMDSYSNGAELQLFISYNPYR